MFGFGPQDKESPRIPLSNVLGGRENLRELQKIAKESPTGQIALTVPRTDIEGEKVVMYLSAKAKTGGAFSQAEVRKSQKQVADVYPGLHKERLAAKDEQGQAERVIATKWIDENVSQSPAMATLAALLGGEVSERDVAVAATIIQWLNTNNGTEFLRQVGIADPRFLERIKS